MRKWPRLDHLCMRIEIFCDCLVELFSDAGYADIHQGAMTEDTSVYGKRLSAPSLGVTLATLRLLSVAKR